MCSRLPRDRVNVHNTCVCPSRSYDPGKVGILRCSPFAWDQPDSAAVLSDSTLPCRTRQCEAGSLTLREGWRLAERATTGSVLTAFQCPYAEITTDNATRRALRCRCP